MENTKKHYVRRAVAVCAAAALAVALAGIAYAADVGGIRQAVQLWFHGSRIDATLNVQGEEYTLTYTDEQGQTVTEMGSGTAVDMDTGEERPLTPEEAVEGLNSMVRVEYNEDGSVWLYYRDQQRDITDEFENGVCYVTLRDSGQTLYVTVTDQGWTTSNEGFSDPDEPLDEQGEGYTVTRTDELDEIG